MIAYESRRYLALDVMVCTKYANRFLRPQFCFAIQRERERSNLSCHGQCSCLLKLGTLYAAATCTAFNLKVQGQWSQDH
jgi:hypothetical protein